MTPAAAATVTSEDKDEAQDIVRASARIRLALPPMYLDDEARANKKKNPAYQKLATILYDTQRQCARVMNVLVRELWRLDGLTLDANQGQPPKPWPFPSVEGVHTTTYLYGLTGRIAPGLSGGVRSTLAKRVSDQWMKTRFDALVRMIRRPQHFRDDVPILLRAADVKIVKNVGADGVGYALDFAVAAGVGQRLQLELRVKDTHQRTILAAVHAEREFQAAVVAAIRAKTPRGSKERASARASDWERFLSPGEYAAIEKRFEDTPRYKMGEISILRDVKNRWHARIAYKRKIAATTNKKAAAINRGLRYFLVGVDDEGKTWQYPGADIIAYLKQIQSRRKEYQGSIVAAGRKGHGRKRTLRPIERLQEKAHNWRRTKCQTIARRFVMWCVDRRVGVIYVEDFAGIREGAEALGPTIDQLIQEWPYYDLETRIISCAQEAGIEVRSNSAAFISQRCPKCGHISEANRDLVRWSLRCEKCNWREHLDVAASKNNLALGLKQWKQEKE